MSAPNPEDKGSIAAITVGALGVVYGDIGTSPLYALRECFYGDHAIQLTEANLLGVLSLVTWALILVIAIKYIGFVLKADNRGEGGILALLALAVPKNSVGWGALAATAIGLFGAALLYGDAVITPAISVLSAVEGLRLVTPFFEPYVVPLTCIILFGLFSVQKFGTHRIGSLFGPILLVWFSVLSVLGIKSILANPHVLVAVSPLYAIQFLLQNQFEGFFVLGAVFLAVTGGEGLYADMGHFGRRPIRIAWFTLVMPALLLNYYGQGALLLSDPKAVINPFYYLAPSWGLLPLVVLSTAATVIASQALISGMFSLTRQAILLGYSPRMKIIHTSSREMGQIYLPEVNWTMFFATVWTVVNFGSSSRLAAAYGVAVSTCIIITTILFAIVAVKRWNWNIYIMIPATIFFLIIDFGFWTANIMKVAQGGWFPLSIGAFVFTFMTTWRRGREILAERLRENSIPMSKFIDKARDGLVTRVPGTAVFMVGDPRMTPPAMVHNVKHNKVLHERVLILTVTTAEVSHVAPKERLRIESLGENFFGITAFYGFMDMPDVQEIIDRCRASGLTIDLTETAFFVGRETVIASSRPGMALWREHLFALMSRNAQRATTFFRVPPDQVIEVGMQVEL